MCDNLKRKIVKEKKNYHHNPVLCRHRNKCKLQNNKINAKNILLIDLKSINGWLVRKQNENVSGSHYIEKNV